MCTALISCHSKILATKEELTNALIQGFKHLHEEMLRLQINKLPVGHIPYVGDTDWTSNWTHLIIEDDELLLLNCDGNTDAWQSQGNDILMDVWEGATQALQKQQAP